MIFSILEVSRDHKRLLTASVPHLSSVVYCKKVSVLKQWSLLTAHVRDHSTAVICFMQKRWLICFNVTLVLTYSETDSVKFKDASVGCNVRELHFQAKSAKFLPKTNSSTIVET